MNEESHPLSHTLVCRSTSANINEGVPWVMENKYGEEDMRIQCKFMVGLNRALEPILKVLQNGRQTVNNVLTREPINDRLYHMNYKTFKL
jgi:hypothetical protein